MKATEAWVHFGKKSPNQTKQIKQTNTPQTKNKFPKTW